jgi:formate hydrogenlyase subunit 3/multisubunit Na+/H+ antiporter MnhD subunit
MVFGLGGLAAVAAIGAASLPAQVALALLLLGAGYAALPGLRSFPVRLRGPAFAAALLAGGALLAAYSTQPLLSRLGGLLLVLGLAAAVGVLPFLQQLVPEEPVSASPIAWMGFIGPAVAIALAPQAQTLLDTASAPVYGAVLIGLGLLNAAWGALGAWRSADPAEAWRYSFLGDWGLALLGLGLLVPAGAAAANLVLVFVVAVRLPLYVMARPAILGHHEPRAGLGALLVAASLCGAAPFAGFPARLLLVRAATEVYWPLAPVVLIALLLWLPGSLRLARGGGSLQGRRAFGVAAVSLVSLAIGVYPAPLLAAFGGST